MKFVFTCGGTAGHINPALAVASKLRELLPSCEILFIGAENMMEMDLVSREGYEIKGITISNISRELSLDGIKHNLKTIRNVQGSIHAVKDILREFKPDCVIGTGGYVCYPVIIAAKSMHIKTAIHESNAFPGLTTNLLARKVDRIYSGFENVNYPDMDKVIYTGTPVRNSFSHLPKAEAKFKLGVDRPLVLSVMGSLGSAHMNKIASETICGFKSDPGFAFVHVTGKMYYEAFEPKQSPYAQIFEYLYNISDYMQAADVIICRSGASTLCELSYLGKPSILVPSPNVTNNHQEKNARVFEKVGASMVLLETEFNSDDLVGVITDILTKPDLLDRMSKAAEGLCVSDSADIIAADILDMVKN